MSEIKPGDRVLVAGKYEVEVYDADATYIQVFECVGGKRLDYWLQPSWCEKIEPKIEVGGGCEVSEQPGTLLAWYFAPADKRLAHGDGRKIILGRTHKVKGAVVPCKSGLHASVSARDALTYNAGPVLYRVELSGEIVAHGDPIDKYAASERKYLAGGKDASPMLREFARWCALKVGHLWNMPDVVKRYLETGDESLRGATTAATAAATATAAAAAYAYAAYAASDAYAAAKKLFLEMALTALKNACEIK